ncbi:MAG: DUF2786 domain-containing protein [Dehalococcoidia bacterium]
MTAPDKLDRIQGVIAALLSKTTSNGCTEQEASSALEKAQELLLRYNLSQEQVFARADGNAAMRAKVGMQDVEVAAGFKWRASLLSAVARANLCRIVISDQGDRGTVHVFGKQENIRVVLDMWSWVSEQLERLGFNSLRDYMQPPQQARWKFTDDGHVRIQPWTPKGTESEAVYLAGFYKAAVQRIDARLAAAMAKFTGESDMTRALVVVSGREVGEAVSRAFPRLGSWSGMGSFAGRDGMRDGARAGDRVSLTRSAALSGAGGATLRLH